MSKKPAQKALVEWAWLALRQAAVRHGKLTWREKLSDSRYKLIEAALRQASPYEVARAVDGFCARASGWSEEIREKSFTPEYILRPTLLDQHIEAAPLWGPSIADHPDVQQAQVLYSKSISSMLDGLVPTGPVVAIPVEQELREAGELRALGFYGEIGDRR